MSGFDFGLIADYAPEFWRGTIATITYSLASLVLALAIGLTVALARMSRLRTLSVPARVIIDVIRGTPALVQIFFIYFGMPAIGVNLSAPVAGVIALGLNTGGYLAEIFRAGIESIAPGQWDAGRSLGLHPAKIFWLIVLPQAALRAVPPSAGEVTSLVKGTSLLSTISISELTRVGQQIIGVTFRPIEAYAAIGLIYLLLNGLVAQGALMLERTLRRRQGL